jgi:hypothetical protein
MNVIRKLPQADASKTVNKLLLNPTLSWFWKIKFTWAAYQLLKLIPKKMKPL